MYYYLLREIRIYLLLEDALLKFRQHRILHSAQKSALQNRAASHFRLVFHFQDMY